MIIRRNLLILLFSLPLLALGQSGKYSGRVIDMISGQPLALVNIQAQNGQGTVSNDKGEFELELPAADYMISFSFVGYAKFEDHIKITPGQIIHRTIRMSVISTGLSETIVVASRYSQNIAEVPVSIENIRPELIQSTNAHEMEQIMQRVPGVMMMDGQANIRGGSGYAFGTGSRVMMLVDGLPLLTGASGEAKWDFLPMGNIERVEVMKGASSVLYGSSALNGTVNVTTAWPGIEAEHKLRVFSGLYMIPDREEIKWWGNNVQNFGGLEFSQSRKEGNFDIVTGLGAFTDNGYKESDDNHWYRWFLKTRYRAAKVEGLSFGLSAAMMEKKGQTFLLWQDGDTNVLRPNPVSVQDFNNSRFHIDPFIQWFRNEKVKHLLQGRYYWVNNRNNTDQNNRESVLFGEYQFVFRPSGTTALVAGINAQWGRSAAQLFGDSLHSSQGMAAYTQLDKRFRKLILTAGARWESMKIDDDPATSRPVFRAGANYALTPHSHLRASYGQGFRYPSVAEKYTVTQVGSLRIFPNPGLKSESGWSTEAGWRQDFRIGNLQGYLDLAVFWMEYRDMIEFTFGQHYPDSIVNPSPIDFINYTGFKAFNIGSTRINGAEISAGARGRIFGYPSAFMFGYTFTNPIDPSFDSNITTASTNRNILKYRSRSSLKLDAEMTLGKLTLGLGLFYFSHIVNIDKAFEDTIRFPNGAPIIQANGKPLMIMPDLHEYRLEHNKGAVVVDIRVSYTLHRDSQIALILKNALNSEYMIRPGSIEAPRNVALQYNVRF